MALKKKPVTGMKDILPAEMEIRDYVIRLIKETYSGFGFSSIDRRSPSLITQIALVTDPEGLIVLRSL